MKNRFPRNKIIVSVIDEQWQADLVDLQASASCSNGNKYMLKVIDIFLEFAFGYQLKNRKAESIVDAFSEIFRTRIPIKLQTDQANGTRRTIKMKPIQVTASNQTHVFINAYGTSKRSLIKNSPKLIKQNTS
ncbi:NACHT: LRR and PYD domains-containing protein 3-like protein, partial [Leptotrombidium deliense]